MDTERGDEHQPLTPAERQFLLDSGAPPDSFDPAAQARARASLRRRADETRRKASPELTLAQAAGLLGATEAQVTQWAAELDLYSRHTENGLSFPEWQFPHGQRLPGLRPVLRELGPRMHPHSVEGLLAEVPHEELDNLTAVEWLARGSPTEPVVCLAESSHYDM
ncbi:hypothetical protein L2K70_11155 [Nocardioides KLBMP 9356]|uniref:Uncharacterized protein n=1 Tax=Nocardioides potassii TaxID=2911371 RepID=A0ABS9HAC6_9ACTN|nr:hypothetical protein [Nocardioides potassii]MCF6378160.1 hypothetical protein [Nocardioides potassii]